MLNQFNTSKAKKIRKVIKGERGYLLSLAYMDARKRKPWFIPTFIFNPIFDYLFLGKGRR
jgi:hypothetical protein